MTDAAGNPLHTELQLADKTITTDITYDEKGRATLVVYDYGAAVPSETVTPTPTRRTQLYLHGRAV